jgi:hypothetical protein
VLELINLIVTTWVVFGVTCTICKMIKKLAVSI